MHLWNVGKFLSYYAAQLPRSQATSHPSSWESDMLQIFVLPLCWKSALPCFFIWIERELNRVLETRYKDGSEVPNFLEYILKVSAATQSTTVRNAYEIRQLLEPQVVVNAECKGRRWKPAYDNEKLTRTPLSEVSLHVIQVSKVASVHFNAQPELYNHHMLKKRDGNGQPTGIQRLRNLVAGGPFT
jgi:hypothetical protein